MATQCEQEIEKFGEDMDTENKKKSAKVIIAKQVFQEYLKEKVEKANCLKIQPW